MRSIPVAICKISSNNFKRHNLKKKKLFLEFFIAFLKGAWNVEHFQKKDEYPSLVISEILESEGRGYLNV